MTMPGSASARRNTTSARLADAGISAAAGMLYSRMGSPFHRPRLARILPGPYNRGNGPIAAPFLAGSAPPACLLGRHAVRVVSECTRSCPAKEGKHGPTKDQLWTVTG